MRAIVNLILATMLIAGLTGCAATSSSMPAKVKCPACGHDFSPPPPPAGG
jgi:hypothetical protein